MKGDYNVSYEIVVGAYGIGFVLFLNYLMPFVWLIFFYCIRGFELRDEFY